MDRIAVTTLFKPSLPLILSLFIVCLSASASANNGRQAGDVSGPLNSNYVLNIKKMQGSICLMVLLMSPTG
jgi:hypothetical protein